MEDSILAFMFCLLLFGAIGIGIMGVLEYLGEKFYEWLNGTESE